MPFVFFQSTINVARRCLFCNKCLISIFFFFKPVSVFQVFFANAAKICAELSARVMQKVFTHAWNITACQPDVSPDETGAQ